VDFSNLNTSQKAPLFCRNNCMTLAIKCRELLTKAKKLNRKALTIRESRNQVSGKAPNDEILSLY
jgi:hypothetical protein